MKNNQVEDSQDFRIRKYRKRVQQGINKFYYIVLYAIIGSIIGFHCFMPNTVEAAKRMSRVKYYVVSRMEKSIVILEDDNGKQKKVNRKNLPKRIKEEDVLAYKNGKYRLDVNQTKVRKQRIEWYMKFFFIS